MLISLYNQGLARYIKELKIVRYDLDFVVIPDEISEHNDFHNFVDNPKLRMTYLR